MYYLLDFTVPGYGKVTVPKYNAATAWGGRVYNSTQVSLPNGQYFDAYGLADAPADGVRRIMYPCVILPRVGAPFVSQDPLAEVQDVRGQAEGWQTFIGKTGVLQRAAFGNSAVVHQCTARLVEVVTPTGATYIQPFQEITLIFEPLEPWRWTFRNIFGGTTLLSAPNKGNRIAAPVVNITVVASSGATRAEVYNDTAGAAVRMTFTPSASGLDTLILNTQTMEATYNGVNIYSGVSFLSSHKRIEWMPILPGGNAMRVYVPGSGLNGWSIRYWDTYY